MARYREAFNELSSAQLKELISSSVEMLKVAAPFKDVHTSLDEIVTASAKADKPKLQDALHMCLKVVEYWNNAQKDQFKGQPFSKAQKNIVLEKLESVKECFASEESLDPESHLHKRK